MCIVYIIYIYAYVLDLSLYIYIYIYIYTHTYTYFLLAGELHEDASDGRGGGWVGAAPSFSS